MKRLARLRLLLALFAPLLLALAALVGLGVGIALKTDVPTALIAVCSILLIDVALDGRTKRGAE